MTLLTIRGCARVLFGVAVRMLCSNGAMGILLGGADAAEAAVSKSEPLIDDQMNLLRTER